MTKMTNEEVVAFLQAGNIPPSVYSLTLPKMGRDDLRAWVALPARERTRGLWFYPEDVATADYFRSMDLFYLTAKELLLTGHSVGCFDLIELMDTIEAQDFSFQGYRFWFLMDTYVQGLACPYTPGQLQRLGRQLREHVRRRQGYLVLHADASLKGAAAWWPAALLNLFQEHCAVIPVSVRGE